MKFIKYTTVSVTNEKLHSELVKVYKNGLMGGLTNDNPDDISYGVFSIRLNHMSGKIPELLNIIINEIHKTDANIGDFSILDVSPEVF